MPMPQLERIDDPIAEDWWGYTTPDGQERLTRIVIGRPLPIPDDPHGDWCCPLVLPELFPHVECVGGVGPVDALANAMALVKVFQDSVGGITPRAGPPAGVERPS
jgi:hypothetical protein